MLVRNTKYAREITTGEFSDYRIERIYVKGLDREEIRFSWWPKRRMAGRPLDVTEDELLALLQKAIEARVFTDAFLGELKSTLDGSEARLH